MSRVMNALYYLILLLVFSSALLPPWNVQLVSENFRHILTWKDNNTNASVHYNVKYRISGQKRISINECTNITYRRCDLTGYFTDIMKAYEVYVQSFTHDSVSKFSPAPDQLIPIKNTVLGPPIVSVTAGPELINITISPPTSHLKSANKKHTLEMLNVIVYPMLTYTIMLIQSNLVPWTTRNETEVVYVENANVTIDNLLPHTTYCVSVMVSASSNTNPRKIPSALECATTQEHARYTGHKIVWIAISIAGVLLAISILMVLFGLDFTGFLCIRKKLPDVLTLIPESESTSHRIRDYRDPEYATPVASISQVQAMAHTINQDGCRQNYICGRSLLEYGQSDRSSVSKKESLLPATSSSAESSDEECGPLDEDVTPKELAPDMDITVRNAPNICFQENALNNITCALSRQSNEATNISFKSVSLGDPDIIWKSLKMDMSPVERQKIMTTSHGSVTSPGISDTFYSEAPDVEQSVNYISEEEDISIYNNYNDTEEDFTSDYLKRNSPFHPALESSHNQNDLLDGITAIKE